MSDDIEQGDVLQAMFDLHRDEFLHFERIPAGERRHVRPDLCAMLYLHERFGGTGDAVTAVEHDQLWLTWDRDLGGLTIADVVYILRCGVLYDEQTESLSMFV